MKFQQLSHIELGYTSGKKSSDDIDICAYKQTYMLVFLLLLSLF